MKKKIEKGTLIIRKSTDNYTWVNAVEPIQGFLVDKKLDKSKIYTISDDDFKNGTYFQVILAYEMQQRTGVKENWGIIPDDDIYQYIYCTEVYCFYVCYSHSAVTIKDTINGNELQSGSVAPNGFTITNSDATSVITVNKDGRGAQNISAPATFTEKGSYIVEIAMPNGQKYSYSISVSDGLRTLTTNPIVFQNEKKDKYVEENPVSGATAFGETSHTALTIAHDSEKVIVRATKNGIPAYGVSGSQVSLFFRLKDIRNADWGTTRQTPTSIANPKQCSLAITAEGRYPQNSSPKA